MSTNISENYTIINHATNSSERSKSVLGTVAAATVDLVAQTMIVSFFDGGTFTLTDTDDLSKTYVFDDDNTDGATGAITGSNVVIQLNGLADVDDIADQIAIGVNHSNGHAGTITAAAAGAASGKVILTQATDGEAGNTIIESTTSDTALEFLYLGTPVTSFQTGADGGIISGSLDIMSFRPSINGAQSIRFQTTSGYYQTFIGEQKQ